MTKLPRQPLVTFALFAYNQEKYIREAVEGAFSQTYEPMEIILSDDCSSDRTFEIMQEMAAVYDGPHDIRVRRNAFNAGLASHINLVAKVASGDIVMMAAGDDISMPDRTRSHVEVYKENPKAFAVLSNYTTLPEGHCKMHTVLGAGIISWLEVAYNGGGVQIGATYSYQRQCLTWPAEIPCWVDSEDRLLPFRATLLGNVIYLRKTLVKYRLPTTVNGTDYRERRIHGMNNRQHFPLLFSELEIAISDGTIPVGAGILRKLYLNARALQVHLLTREQIPRNVVNILFLPLRIFRKVSVLLSRGKTSIPGEE